MVRKHSARVRNALANAFEDTIGGAPTLEIRTGAPPASASDADSGTLIASGVLPADWLQAASGGQKVLNGTWTVVGLPAAGGGTVAGHFRIKGTGGVVDDQGTITITGGGGDMTMDNPNIANGQSSTVTVYTIIIGGA